jgi:hypothetical protein
MWLFQGSEAVMICKNVYRRPCLSWWRGRCRRKSRGRLLCSLIEVDGFGCKSVFREEVPLILCCFALECRVYASDQVDTKKRETRTVLFYFHLPESEAMPGRFPAGLAPLQSLSSSDFTSSSSVQGASISYQISLRRPCRINHLLRMLEATTGTSLAALTPQFARAHPADATRSAIRNIVFTVVGLLGQSRRGTDETDIALAATRLVKGTTCTERDPVTLCCVRCVSFKMSMTCAGPQVARGDR